MTAVNLRPPQLTGGTEAEQLRQIQNAACAHRSNGEQRSGKDRGTIRGNEYATAAERGVAFVDCQRGSAGRYRRTGRDRQDDSRCQ